MKRRALHLLTGIAIASAAASAAWADEKRVTWIDLTAQTSGEVGSTATASRAATPLAEGQIRIEGFLLPVDREGDLVYEFMLVPYPGACSHTAQPPPNQMIHVFPAKPYRSVGNYEPVAVGGLLKARDETTQLFIVDGVKVIESGYEISAAMVVSAPSLRPPPTPGNPLLSKRK